MTTSKSIAAKIEAFTQDLVEEFGEIDDSSALSWLDAIETKAVEIGDAIATELLKKKSAARPIEAAEATCPQCGKLGRYRATRERELISRRGSVSITEPEYFCPCCRKAFFPADQRDRG